MRETRIHGRSGQGNLVAAHILAQAVLEQGRSAQAFPAVGEERRRLPLSAFVRITAIPLACDRDRIACAQELLQPTFLLLQDHALLHARGITEELPPEGKILVNWSRQIGPVTARNGQRIVVMAASNLAMEYLDKPLPNTALLAALLTLTQMAPLAALENAMARHFRDETLQRNIRLPPVYGSNRRQNPAISKLMDETWRQRRAALEARGRF